MTCMRITALSCDRRDLIVDRANRASRLAFCFEAGAGSGASDSTASLEVRNNVYPLPRARYFTCGSVCPRFGSKATGRLLKLSRRDFSDAEDKASPLLAFTGRGVAFDRFWLAADKRLTVPRNDTRCGAWVTIVRITQPIRTHVRDNPSLRLGSFINFLRGAEIGETLLWGRRGHN